MQKGVPLLFACGAIAQPSLTGQMGYINMPSARVGNDGTLSFGYGYDKPYGILWTSLTLLPWLEVSGRYTSIADVEGFQNQQYGGGYGRYKDKAIDTKFRLLEETTWLPEVSLGLNDIQGNRLWKGTNLIATKQVLPGLEATIGHGSGRIQGMFGGLRYTPSFLPNWSLVAEYDANNYPQDPAPYGIQTYATEKRNKGPAVGLEYQWGWLGLQMAWAQKGSVPIINAHVDIPLNVKEYVPKIQEPAYFSGGPDIPARPTLEQWNDDSARARQLATALGKQDFKNIRIAMQRDTLVMELSNSQISNVGRAVGRAVRTALYFAPLETREIRVVYTELEQPVATYNFYDLQTLNDYLLGKADRTRFLETVNIKPGRDEELQPLDSQTLAQSLKQGINVNLLTNQEADLIQVTSDDTEDNHFHLAPKMGVYFNDPSGAFHYDIMAEATYKRRLDKGLYLDSALSADLANTITQVTQPSNSLLPHVRSDIADYKRVNPPKLNRLLLNQYMTLGSNLYARASAGIYEEMFRGAGGQILYYPSFTSNWAADLAVDALQQRDFKGWFGKRDYQTITAIASLHYQLPMGMTATMRGGRFLAKDDGVRFELSRRFQSGIEAGFWYTVTNGHDTTSPGTPSKPYNDKGVFFSIPLNSLLTFDSRNIGDFSLSPWTRDVGQMVMTPGDLYEILRNPKRDINAYDGLGNFAERPDEQNLPQVTPPVPDYNPWPVVKMRLDDSGAQWLNMDEKTAGFSLAVLAVAAAAAGDKSMNQFFQNHEQNRLVKDWGKLGKDLPYVTAALSGAAFALGDSRLSNTGLIALESGALAVAGSEALKYTVNRERPGNDNSAWNAQAGGVSRWQSSFTSNHAAFLFATVTPFAKEYNQPWLYGLAALAAAGRVASRDHWFSDVAAGSVLGYVAGNWLWQAQRDNSRYQSNLLLTPKQVGVQVNVPIQ
ncbi:YjbH domain-containing protein [Chromobacterium sp. IIBBL 290-4]|uniref:YjbH domain-containing protein n=1 Tax=Chromobacterium sp. IIBBL 290-4 TaxID=2953890 RepID=UPI0020B66B75|nr:YjbH domain-containing protein [Chromobacterium sp. IIBBL 290-4]UTH75323.1 YjbH domain-containing protein [Chromobacterium sp. IIBBL 290-4]